MDAAATAVNRLFSKSESDPVSSPTTNDPSSTDAPTKSTTGRDVDTAVDEQVAPAVEHEHVKKTHETREQKFVEKERHQDHYHTTVQPLKDSEVLPEKHDQAQETEHRSFNHDDQAAKAKAEADRSEFSSTSEQKEFESKTQEPTQQTEHVHHHLHETVQPVIEKEVIDPSVTHKRIDIKEKHQEPSEHHGVTTNSAISIDQFKDKLDGDESTTVVDGKAV